MGKTTKLVATLETLHRWFEHQSELGHHYNSPDMESFDGSMEGYIQKKLVEANGQTWEDYCKALAKVKP